MKLLVVGGSGMLGHKMFQTLGARFEDTWCTIRGRRSDALYAPYPFLHGPKVIEGVEVMDLEALERLIEEHRFDAVVNCIGVIKQRDDATVAIPSITINSLMPHRLAALAGRWGGRVIHFSTDCVFSGRRGDYSEDDESDALDLYGKSKFLGEVGAPNALTLRTSIVGRELHHHHSLLDWFLSQQGKTIRGFQRHWWSGVTTNHLADLVGTILAEHPSLRGLYQVSSGKISKYDLLLRFRDAYGVDVDIQPDDAAFLDRSLTGHRLREAIGYEPPSWDAMLGQLVADHTSYPIAVTPRR
jgi:dTDP-4-dehydrorhamnose reductase